jgi:hypothetical protein
VGVAVSTIVDRLNSLPGAPLDAHRVGRAAVYLKLKRPPGYRSVAALGPYKPGWKQVVGERAPEPDALLDHEIARIEQRNKGNDDVLFLLRETARIQGEHGWDLRRRTVDLRPHEMANMEMRQKGNEDFQDLMAELRRLNAIPK